MKTVLVVGGQKLDEDVEQENWKHDVFDYYKGVLV